jgi:hypothetical protein
MDMMRSQRTWLENYAWLAGRQQEGGATTRLLWLWAIARLPDALVTEPSLLMRRLSCHSVAQGHVFELRALVGFKVVWVVKDE